jgi:hypothetical protein
MKPRPSPESPWEEWDLRVRAPGRPVAGPSCLRAFPPGSRVSIERLKIVVSPVRVRVSPSRAARWTGDLRLSGESDRTANPCRIKATSGRPSPFRSIPRSPGALSSGHRAACSRPGDHGNHSWCHACDRPIVKRRVLTPLRGSGSRMTLLCCARPSSPGGHAADPHSGARI